METVTAGPSRTGVALLASFGNPDTPPPFSLEPGVKQAEGVEDPLEEGEVLVLLLLLLLLEDMRVEAVSLPRLEAEFFVAGLALSGKYFSLSPASGV